MQIEAESPAESPSPNNSQKKKRRDRIVRGYDERTSYEVPPMRQANQMPELSLPQSSDREARIRANLEKNAELEAKIADL